MNKKCIAFLVAIITVFGMVACSNDITTTTTTATTTSETESTTTLTTVSTTTTTTQNPNLVTLMQVADTITIENANNITEDFTLLGAYGNSITITWTSNNTEVIAISATTETVGSDVVYPVTISPSNVDVAVELVATFTLNSVQHTKTFNITVKALVDDGIYRSVSDLYENAALTELVVFNGYVSVVYNKGYVLMDNNGDSLIVYTTADYINLVKIGDKVTISGTYSQYNSLFQITTLTSQVINSSNNVVTISPINLANATDLLSVNSTVKLNHGKVYTVTVTPVINVSNNVELYDGATKVAVVYYESPASSIAALKSYEGREVTIDVLYYTLHSTDGIRVLFYGLEGDIEAEELTLEQKFAIDIDLIDNPLELTDSLVLPTLVHSTYDVITISTGLTDYLSFTGGEFTVTRPTALEGDRVGTLTVKITIGEEFREVIVSVTFKALTNSVATDLFISEYIEGSSFNKLIELYNATSSSIDLSGYKLELYSNGSVTVSNSLILSSTNSVDNVSTILLPGKTAVIYHGSIEQKFIDSATANGSIRFISSTVINFNGDDAVVLRKTSGEVVDSIGKVGIDPGDFWGNATVSTKDMTLVRKSYIVFGDTVINDDFDPNLEWIAYPINTETNVGTHVSD